VKRVQHPNSLVDGAVVESEQIVSRMTFIAHNCGHLEDETGEVYVCQEGEWRTNDLSGCVNYELKSFPVVFCAAPTSHSNAAGKNALNGASV